MHLKKLPSGFECRLCSHQTTHNEGLALKPRIRMYNHLKDSHSEKFDISNRDELKENKKPERNNKNDQLKAQKMPERIPKSEPWTLTRTHNPFIEHGDVWCP